MTGQTAFRPVYIAFAWDWDVAWAGTYTAGTGTLNTSQYFPYNAIGPIKLSITNLYNLIDVQSGIDLAIFNAIRPYHKAPYRFGDYYTAPTAWPYSPEANDVTSSSYTSASTTMKWPLTIPACCWFDEYVEIDDKGNLLQRPVQNTPVTPLYMSGTSRDITPQITMAPGLASNTDNGPVVAAPAGTASFTGGSVTSNFQRKGMYATDSVAEMPRVWNWRYALASTRINLGAVSSAPIRMKNVLPNGGGGQLLSVFFRFYDPAAGANSQGAAIALSTISNGVLKYGSNLIRYDDTERENLKRFYRQHQSRLPVGVWIWDMAVDKDNRVTNAEALNTYLTDVEADFTFTSTLSSSAYVVVGCEYLAYVLDGPAIA
jgi:hypothetical protein